MIAEKENMQTLLTPKYLTMKEKNLRTQKQEEGKTLGVFCLFLEEPSLMGHPYLTVMTYFSHKMFLQRHFNLFFWAKDKNVWSLKFLYLYCNIVIIIILDNLAVATF